MHSSICFYFTIKSKLMFKRSQIVITILIAVVVIPMYSSAQKDKGKKDSGAVVSPLVGTWRLIEFTDLDTTTGVWGYRYGKNPRGYFTYTPSGIVNLNISSGSPYIITEDSAKKHSVNLLDFIDHYALGYFGTYTVDLNKSIVVHNVKGGSIPWYIDTDQPRPFVLKNDTLTIGDGKKWKRVLVKVD